MIIDIGANLLDGMFQGIYNGRQCHFPDIDRVIDRAVKCRLSGIIITAGTLSESKAARHLITTHQNAIKLWTTVGIHPTNSSNEIDWSEMILNAKSDQIVAIGECGLDYLREQYCDRQRQQIVFEQHFKLASATQKPMFLHLRHAFSDFYSIVSRNRQMFTTGVVHSFDGDLDQAKALIDLNLYIGINGCSLRTPESLKTVCQLPLDRLMVESDAPWCQLRPSHSSHSLHDHLKVFGQRERDKHAMDCMVKGRNEPAACLSVCQVIANLKNISLDAVIETVHQSTVKVFSIY